MIMNKKFREPDLALAVKTCIIAMAKNDEDILATMVKIGTSERYSIYKRKYKEIKIFISDTYKLEPHQGLSPVFYVLSRGNIQEGFNMNGVFSSKEAAETEAIIKVFEAGNYIITPVLAIRIDEYEDLVSDWTRGFNVNNRLTNILK